MSKFDVVLERVRRLPPERQDAIAIELGVLLDGEENGSLITDEEWAAIEATLDEDHEEIPHDQIVSEFRAKYPG